MDHTIVLSKTDAARLLLSQRDTDLARAIRSFLIMVDGRRSLAQLRPMMDALGVTVEAIRQLVEQGLLHLHQDVGPAPITRRVRVAADAVPEAAAPSRSPSSTTRAGELGATRPEAPQAMPPAATTPDQPDAPKERPAATGLDARPERAEPARTMAAAKFYALNLVTLMLVGQDEGPRRAVREATTPQQLADWLTMCLDLVHDTAGPERAQVFADKIWAVLPDEVRVLVDQDWLRAEA